MVNKEAQQYLLDEQEQTSLDWVNENNFHFWVDYSF